ncbi:efflux transporter outer membrane subunit [Gammaproteobacteria bacterium]|nr:efflux transporter outer membrane subunit [Gammaproteobacteria bacterium]
MIRLTPLIALTLISGCASEPTPSPEVAPGESVQARLEQQWAAGQSSLSAGAVSDRWLDELSMTPLKSWVDEAMAGNPSLQAMAARVEAADARARVRGAAQLPSVGAGLGASRQRRVNDDGNGLLVSNSATEYSLNLDIAWEVDWWGRLADQTRAARYTQLHSWMLYQSSRLSLASRIARQWVLAVRAQQVATLSEDTLEAEQKNLASIEDAYRHGTQDALTLSSARASLSLIAQQREQARSAEADARRALQVLIGRYPDGQIAIGDALPFISAPVPAGLPSELLRRRPDIVAAELSARAALSERVAADKALLPGFSLSASTGTGSDALEDLLDPDRLIYQIVAGLTAPLFRGGELRARVDEAEAQFREALAGYRDVLLQALLEVENALDADHYLARQAEILEASVTQARLAESLALEQFYNGLVGIAVYLDARRRALDAESRAIGVRADRLDNRIALHLALGGDFAGRSPHPDGEDD